MNVPEAIPENDAALLALAQRLATETDRGMPRALMRLAGGRNNQVYRLDTDDGPLLLKRYPSLTNAQLLALFSINLGFINLLPVPMLDGGHLFLYVVEAVRRRPVSAEALDWRLLWLFPLQHPKIAEMWRGIRRNLLREYHRLFWCGVECRRGGHRTNVI